MSRSPYRAHALLVAGDESQIPAALEHLSRAGGIADRFVRTYADMGIDDARDVRDRALTRGMGERRAFVIVAGSITAEAQNALLKTLEEPSAGASFVLIVPAPDTLLPTLRSRMERLVLAGTGTSSPIDPEAFLAAPPARRIEMLKVLTAADEKDTAGTLAFLSGLERALAGRGAASARESIRALYAARAYIIDKGALRKALLESVALCA